MKGRADRGKWGAEIAAVVLCIVLLGVLVCQKEGFHMDELLSFELSNAEFNPWIVPTQPEGRLAKFVRNEIDGDSLGETLGNFAAVVEDVVRNRGGSKLLTYKADVYGEPVWITGEQFLDYITARKGDAFNYLSVYFNVKDDNHPPLHFMLLHTVSSIFRGKACPWMGCAINLAAVAAVLVLLIRLGRMLAEALGLGRYSRQAGLLCALLYGLSCGAAATVLLIRMYAMLTLWCVALLYVIVKKWRDRSFDRHNKGLIAVTLLGFWTQYFFLFYCVLLAAVALILLLSKKRIREFWCLVRSFAIAAVIGVAAFPFAIADVFSSGRGVEALENLSRGLSGYGQRIAAFWGILWDKALSPGLWIVLAASAVACLFSAIRRRKEVPRAALKPCAKMPANPAAMEAENKPAGKGAYLSMLLIPMAGYFLLAARMSPYLVDRYIMPLFPLAALACGVFLLYALSVLRAFQGGNAGDGKDGIGEESAGSDDLGKEGIRAESAGADGIRKDLTGTESAGTDSAGADTGWGGTWEGAWESSLRNVKQRSVWGICILAVFFQALNLARYDGAYLYLGYKEQESVAAAHEGEACICIYDGAGYYENLKEFPYYSKTLLLKVGELEGRQDTGSIEELGQFVLLVKEEVDADAVLEVFARRYGFVPREQALSGDSVHGDRIYVMMRAS